MGLELGLGYNSQRVTPPVTHICQLDPPQPPKTVLPAKDQDFKYMGGGGDTLGLKYGIALGKQFDWSQFNMHRIQSPDIFKNESKEEYYRKYFI